MNTNSTRRINIRAFAMTAMLSAVAFVLQYIEFPIPMLIPAFVKMDFSDLPELIGAFAIGPVAGVVICAVKNALHLLVTQSGGVGEFSNFILGACFVLPAGLIYKQKKTKRNALIGSMIGAVLMAVVSVASNYFIVYPFYTMMMPMDTIIAAYQAIYAKADTLLKCLVIFNMPFTFVKGVINVVVTMLVYKRISPIIKGDDVMQLEHKK